MNLFKSNKQVVTLNVEKTRLQNSLNKAQKDYNRELLKLEQLKENLEIVKLNLAELKKQIRQLTKQLAS